MLRLWRDEVRIALCPDRLVTLHCKAGLRPRIVARNVQHDSSAPEAGWQAMLPLLKSTLDNPDWRNADATLIISSHFVRFLLLPWSDVSLTDAEKLSLLRHRFAEVYGEASETWELRLNEGSFGSSSLASAVDQELLAQLKNIFNASSLRLKSIQPHLMTVFNACRRELGKGATWFVLAEDGIFSVGLLQNGQWQSIRLRRAGSDWFDEAMLILEREMLLAGTGSNKVFVCAAEGSPHALVRRGELMVHPLLPKSNAALSRQEMSSFAMVAAGI